MKTAFIAMAAVIAVLLAIPMVTDGADAATINLEGDIVLDSDVVYPDGSAIIIKDGTSIDLSCYTMDFGSDSEVLLAGSSTVSCTTGRLVVGEGTIVILDTEILPMPEESCEVTFEGTLRIKFSPPSFHIDFDPSGESREVAISSHSLDISISDMSYSVSLKAASAVHTLLFSDIHEDKRAYNDDGSLRSTRTADIDGGDSGGKIEFSFALWGFNIESVDIYSITVREEYTATGEVCIRELVGIEQLTASVKGYIVHYETGADYFSESRSAPDDPGYSAVFDDVTLELDIDISELIKALDPLNEGKHGNIIKKLKVSSPAAVVEVAEEDPKQLTDLFIWLDGTADAYLFKAGFTEGDASYLFTATEANITSFSISKDLIANISAEISEMTITKTIDDEVLTSFVAHDTTVSASHLDVVGLLHDYDCDGRLDVQDILDNCDRFTLSCAEASFDYDGDTVMESVFRGIGGILTRDGRGLNTLTLTADQMSLALPYDNGILLVTSDDLLLYVESTGSLTELYDAFFRNFHFTTDTHAAIQINSGSAQISYVSGNDIYTLTSQKISDKSPRRCSTTLAVDHSMFSDQTTVMADVTFIGYYLILSIHGEYTEPVGDLDLTLRTMDMTGTVKFVFGDTIAPSANITMPWVLELDYYDINVQAEGSGTVLEVSHGYLDVEGYDYRSQGMLALIDAIKANNFALSLRISATSDSTMVYTDDWQTLQNEFTDVELGVRELDVVLLRDIYRHIGLTELSIRLFEKDGSAFYRYIPVLDMDDDLTGEVHEPWIETNALYITYALVICCVAVTIGIIITRWRLPHLVRFTEEDDDDRRFGDSGQSKYAGKQQR